MGIGRIILIVGMSLALIGYVISMRRHWKFKDFRSGLFRAIFRFLIFIGVVANIIITGKSSIALFVINIICAVLLVLCLIWGVIYLKKFSKRVSHFKKMDGRTYIVKNIYKDD